MQPVKHHDLPQPLSIHLEPEEASNSPVTVEFSVEQVPCVSEPKVSCYRSNGCIVFEGYCPVDSQNLFSQCGMRNTKTDSKQHQDIGFSQEPGETKALYNPFVLWDIIPRLMHGVINGSGLKVQDMADKKLSSGVGNLPASNTLRDKPEKTPGSGFQKESVSVADGANLWNEMQKAERMKEQTTQYSKRDRHTLIYPRITGVENDDDSSDEMSLSHDPFEKRQWKTVGNIADPNKPVSTPVVIDNIQTKSSEEVIDAADLVTQRKWERRAAQDGKMMPPLLQQPSVKERKIPKEDRVSTVLAAYTKSVPLRRHPQEDYIKKDTDSVTVSMSETDSGEIEVALSESDASNTIGSSDGVISLADAACGTGRIDRDASQCVLCGSPLHHRHQDQRVHYAKGASATGKPPRAMVDASTRTSIVEHVQKPKNKIIRKDSTAYPATINRGQPLKATMDVSDQPSSAGRTKHSEEKTMKQKVSAYPAVTNEGQLPKVTMDVSTQASSAGRTKHPEEKTMKQKVSAYPVVTNEGQPQMATMEVSTQASSAGHTKHSKERTVRQEVAAYPVATNEGQLSRGMMLAPTRASTTEHKQHPKERHSRHEITAYPVQTFQSSLSRVTMDAGTSTIEETQKSGKSHVAKPDTFDNDQNVAVYPLSRASSSVFKRKSTDDNTRCTLQHILFPKDACPYSPSLTSLPLDESDIEYIIRRAQLAKASLPADESLCPMERWQLRGHHRHSSKSGRARSSG